MEAEYGPSMWEAVELFHLVPGLAEQPCAALVGVHPDPVHPPRVVLAAEAGHARRRWGTLRRTSLS